MISNETLRLEVLGFEYDFNQSSFNWTFNSFVNDELRLFLDFENPLEISKTKERDWLNVTFLDTLIFVPKA